MPTASTRATFEMCVGTISDPATSQRLLALAPQVERAGSAYNLYGKRGDWSEISGDARSGGADLGPAMVSLYTNSLSRKGSSVRHIYDQIRAGAHGDICPLCVQRAVGTLDHYLEKARFPIYAVCPTNLVPACADCNNARAKERSEVSLTLHPYFDQVEDATWLRAIVIESEAVSVRFEVGPVSEWPALKYQKMQAHFAALALGKLYSTHAAVEMAEIRGALVNLFELTGFIGVKTHLLHQAASRSALYRNSWKGAMYKAFGLSNWFCNGGFSYIPHR
jgi:hypothetical protein